MLRIDNRTARLLLLDLYGLSEPPRRRLDAQGLQALIERIGFVQVDSINTVARAHHMILLARAESYRPEMLTRLLETDRSLFEAWTHDASVIPTRLFAYWRSRFVRERPRILERWRNWREDPFEAHLDQVLDHVRANGPVMARDLKPDKPRDAGGWWDWHPSKTALEFHWRTGALAVARREGFQKVYDLTDRVLPDLTDEVPETPALVDWACTSALARMGFATPMEIAGFWNSIDREEAAGWCADRLGGELIQVEVETAGDGGARRCLMPTELIERLADLPEPPARLRVLSPFDPLIRDRKRLEQIFGFDYRIEVFVPEAKRRYGYYVFPLLEGTRLVGRIDMRRDPATSNLRVDGLWLEPGVRLGSGRSAALEAELARQARFAGCANVTWTDGALRDGAG